MADLSLDELMQLALSAALAGGAELKTHFGAMSRDSVQRKLWVIMRPRPILLPRRLLPQFWQEQAIATVSWVKKPVRASQTHAAAGW